MISHKIRAQLCLTPLREDVGDPVVVQTQPLFEKGVTLGDQLHERVLYAVVYHLDVVAGRAWAQIGDTRPFSDASCHSLEDSPDCLVGLRLPSGHHARPIPGARLPARYAYAQVVHVPGCQGRRPTVGVGEVRVAPVDDYVARTQKRLQLAQHSVHPFAGADHQHDPARLLQPRQKLRGREGGAHPLARLGARATNSLVTDSVRLKTPTRKPLSAMLRTRLLPITPRPIMPMLLRYASTILPSADPSRLTVHEPIGEPIGTVGSTFSVDLVSAVSRTLPGLDGLIPR